MRLTLAVSAALLVGIASRPTFAWGNEGHQVVALVAERHLTPTALKTVESLLGAEGGQLENVSTWADCIKRNTACAADDGPYDQKIHAETKPWHFVDILVTAKAYNPATDCVNNSCVVAQIVADQARLSDTSGASTERLIALKFLVHFVGDVHQPLHAAYKNLTNGKGDQGGNLRFVRGPSGAKTDLHAFWDTNLVEAELNGASNNLAAYAMLIDQGPTPGVGDPVAWANESHALAAKVAYVYPGVDGPHGLKATDPVPLATSYVAKSRTVVRQQLRTAGLRLAAIVNQALDPEGAKAPAVARDLDTRRN